MAFQSENKTETFAPSLRLRCCLRFTIIVLLLLLRVVCYTELCIQGPLGGLLSIVCEILFVFDVEVTIKDIQ